MPVDGVHNKESLHRNQAINLGQFIKDEIPVGMFVVEKNECHNVESTAHTSCRNNPLQFSNLFNRFLSHFRLDSKTHDGGGVARHGIRIHQTDDLKDTILTLAATDDICPISYLDVQRIEPFDTPVSAPYRMDLALTYRCNAACGHCYVGRPRDMESLSTEDWKRVIDKLWDLGIPHAVFTGGEATVHADLAALIRHAEHVGLVTGLLTNGIKLADESYLQELVEAGLDHIQITLESHDEGIHNRMVGAEVWKQTVQGIRNAVATDVYTITNTTLTTLNAPLIEETIEFLKDLGIATFACNSLIYTGKGPSSGVGIPEEELEALMVRVRDKAIAKGMRLIWYTPTQYCEFHPVDLELGAKFCTAARYNMCVEPSGDVIPCQSYYSSLGNILQDDWESIWNHPTAVSIRDRDWVMEKCGSCDELLLCGGGCPLYLQAEGALCVESTSTAI